MLCLLHSRVSLETIGRRPPRARCNTTSSTDVAFCAAVTQQQNYEAEVAQNPGASSYINSPPIWPPPVLSLAPATVEEREAEPGYTDEIELATVYENDGVVYPESDARNPFENPNGHLYKPAPYKLHFASFGLKELQYPVNPRELGPIEDLLKLKINVFSFFDE